MRVEAETSLVLAIDALALSSFKYLDLWLKFSLTA